MRRAALLGVLLAAGPGPVAAGDGPVAAKDEEGAPAGEGAARNLEAWVHEPVALEAPGLRLLLGRDRGSFVLRVQRTGAGLYSRRHRPGFASLRLRDGREVAVDRVEGLRVNGQRARFRAASSEVELPGVELSVEASREVPMLVFGFEVAPGAGDEVEAVTLLDGAFWATDAEGGGAVLPAGPGAWIGAEMPGRARLALRGDARHAAEPGAAWSLPLCGVRRGDTALAVAWDAPRAEVRAERGPSGPGIPGERAVGLSVRLPGPGGRVRVLGDLWPPLGLLDAGRAWRELHARDLRLASLRYKAGRRPGLHRLQRAVVFRPRLAGTPDPPRARGTPRRTFAEVAEAVERLRTDAGVETGLVVLDDWIGRGGGPEAFRIAAAGECGGDAGLEDCAGRVDAAGWFLGLALDRAQLIPDRAARRPRGGAAWRRALGAVESEESFARLAERTGAALLLLREPPGEGASDELLAARRALLRRAHESFPLLATNVPPRLGEDLDLVSFVEGLLPRAVLPPAERALPLVPAVHGLHFRLLPPPGEALAPDDAAGLLAHLLYGQPPVLALPPGEGEDPAGPGPEWAFAREGGWSAGRGLGAHAVFAKHAAELWAALGGVVAREPLVVHRALDEEGRVLESRFGHDLRIVVNLGREPWEDEASETLLPPLGFHVQHPFFVAFRALRANGVRYDEPAFFVVRSLEGKMYLRAERTRIFHGGGPARIEIGARELEVEREAVVRLR